MGRRRYVRDAAIDSTGLSATSASPYFVKRRSRKGNPWKAVVYHRFPKLGVVSDVTNHFILVWKVGSGTRPDVAELRELITHASGRVNLDRIVADAGYDSESNHEFVRDELNCKSIIPPKHGRLTTKPAKGRYRRMMQTHFNRVRYRQRAQVETVMSMLKRRQGSHCNGRTYWIDSASEQIAIRCTRAAGRAVSEINVVPRGPGERWRYANKMMYAANRTITFSPGDARRASA